MGLQLLLFVSQLGIGNGLRESSEEGVGFSGNFIPSGSAGNKNQASVNAIHGLAQGIESTEWYCDCDTGCPGLFSCCGNTCYMFGSLGSNCECSNTPPPKNRCVEGQYGDVEESCPHLPLTIAKCREDYWWQQCKKTCCYIVDVYKRTYGQFCRTKSHFNDQTGRYYAQHLCDTGLFCSTRSACLKIGQCWTPFDCGGKTGHSSDGIGWMCTNNGDFSKIGQCAKCVDTQFDNDFCAKQNQLDTTIGCKGNAPNGQPTEWACPATCEKCNPTEHTIGGTVTGLSKGDSVTLYTNGESITVDDYITGIFTFPGKLPLDSDYNVVVKATSAGISCAVKDASGIMTEAEVSLDVMCMTGTIPTAPAVPPHETLPPGMPCEDSGLCSYYAQEFACASVFPIACPVLCGICVPTTASPTASTTPPPRKCVDSPQCPTIMLEEGGCSGEGRYFCPVSCHECTPNHCDTVKWSKNDRCGPEHDDAVCTGGLSLYCSTAGWCGDSGEYGWSGSSPYNYPEECAHSETVAVTMEEAGISVTHIALYGFAAVGLSVVIYGAFRTFTKKEDYEALV